jgi:hypothetical protein
MPGFTAGETGGVTNKEAVEIFVELGDGSR